MEVTRLNFYALLPEIQQAISDSVFLAIDGEFTGLNTGQEVHCCETPESFYAKLRNTSLEFLFIQFGLAAFMYNNETDKFTHKAFNFYLFPRPVYRGSPDVKFLCQASCVEFLVTHGFNFNKLFRDGIQYLNQPEELDLRDKLIGVHRARIFHQKNEKNVVKNDKIEIPTELESIVEDAMSKISDFVNQTNKTDVMVLGRYTGFERKLIHQQLRLRFCKNAVALDTVDDHLVAIRFERSDDRQRREDRLCEREIQGIDNALGFAKIIKIITESGKWVVGHNMFLDLCHMIKRFCLPLPVDYNDFKDMLHTLLPKLFDTKVLCNSDYFKNIMKSTALLHVFERVQKPPFIFENVEPEGGPDKGYNNTQEKQHEAGFDAYITGMVYLSVSRYVGSLQNSPQRPVLPDSDALRNLSNKLFLIKMLDTYVNMEGPDPVPDRSHVFHVTYPSGWRIFQIEELFIPFGNGQITVLDDGAYVALYNRSYTEQVMRYLVQYPELPYGVRVITYAEHQKRINKKQHRMSIYHNEDYTPPTAPPVRQEVPPERSYLLKKVHDSNGGLDLINRVFQPYHVPAISPCKKIPAFNYQPRTYDVPLSYFRGKLLAAFPRNNISYRRGYSQDKVATAGTV